MTHRCDRALQGHGSDLMPVCPRCGDLSAPLARACETCGSYLRHDDALRDLQVSVAYARRLSTGVVHTVDKALLDRAACNAVPSRP